MLEMPKFPIPFHWAAHYSRKNLLNDLLAGITVGTMLIPQGLAYAKLANLPPIVGLYSSFVPILIYAALGTSPHMALGPVALVSLLTGEAVQTEAELKYPGMDALADEGPIAEYRVAVASLLALISGATLLLLGFLSAGPVLDFLSHPVLAGFTSAAAFIIGASQLKHVFQIDVPSDSVIGKLVDVFSRTDDWNGYAILTASIGLGMLLTLRALGRKYPKAKLIPGVVVVVFLAIIIVYAARLDKDSSANLKIVGEIPSGIDIAAFPNFDWDVFQRTALEGVLIGLIGFLEASSVGKAFATKYGYEYQANKELFAIGGANVIAAFFTSYPTTGGFSRTAVNAVAGAKTLLGSLVSCLFILLTLLFLTPLFTYLPNAILAAVILAAVVSLVEIKTAKHLWAVSKQDFTVMIVTFVSTLVFGIEIGLLLAVAFSLAVFIRQSSSPHSAVLGKLPGTKLYRNINRFANLELTPGVVVWRMDAPLFFGNTSFFQSSVQALIDTNNPNTDKDDSDSALDSALDSDSSISVTASRYSMDSDTTATNDDDDETTTDPESGSFSSASQPRTVPLKQKVKSIVLDMSSVASIDSSGLECMVEVLEWVAERRVGVFLAGVRGPVRDALSNPAAGVEDVFDLDVRCFRSVDDAVKVAKRWSPSSLSSSSSSDLSSSDS